jgi:uncharacterized protein YndB with AHSA1/START domain
MNIAKVTHGQFTIDRSYAAPPAKVFAAFADPKAKRRWFFEGEGFTTQSYEMDFRVGGYERTVGGAPGGTAYTNDAVYHDIVPDRRIIFSYAMTLKGQQISVSLGTIELAASGAGTAFKYTEQAAFLEGSDGPIMREQGCRALFTKLEKELTR